MDFSDLEHKARGTIFNYRTVEARSYQSTGLCGEAMMPRLVEGRSGTTHEKPAFYKKGMHSNSNSDQPLVRSKEVCSLLIYV